MGSTVQIIVLVLCIFLSAFFSASETAFSSCNRIRLQTLEQEGSAKAKKTLKVLDEYDAMLSTILIGNNIVNIGASSLATLLFVAALGDIGASVSTIVLTVVILIFSEVTPKSVAKEIPETFAMLVATPMSILMKLFTPLNFLFGAWKKLVKKVLHLNSEDKITEGEFLTMVDEAEDDGGIDKEDSELIHSVLEFNDCEVDEILTPRVDIVAVALNEKTLEIDRIIRETDYTRIPVYDEDIDDIVGFIHQKDFAEDVMYGELTVADILQPVQYVAPNTKISKLLTLLQQKHAHIAIVVDEFGGTEGIVTMEDILEELVGEIYDEHDEVERNIVKTGKDMYLVQCAVDLEDMFDYFHMEEPECESNTVAGWVLEQYGDFPKVGQQFTYENLVVTAKTVEPKRVVDIRVKVVKNEERTDSEE